MKALSFIQPWAWLIVHGHKDVENRTWFSQYEGPLLVHASKGMTRAQYAAAAEVVDSINRTRPPEAAIALPPSSAIDRGGIVGRVTMVTCRTRVDSPWFFGPYGFVLRNAEPLPFRPFKGMLGFFDVGVTEPVAPGPGPLADGG